MNALSHITNADRAEWARTALEAFQSACPQDEDEKTCIKDLITDLLHLARRECGVDDAMHFATLAANMHDAEVIEDDEGDDDGATSAEAVEVAS
ncbi:hypothetical protein [Mesorhizobium sp. M0058]|uniref:hypothetical protein n=1 Tax=Mesorhizobium sp. M0058 TaxID=2956865 RepID=UPI00333B7EB6